MSYAFKLIGKCVVENSAALAVVGDFEFRANITESLALSKKLDTVVFLDADPVEAVSLGDLAGAHVWMLKVLTSGAGKVLATLTHANGSAQVIPLDPFQMGICSASPVTAISLQRSTGVSATVQVLLGEKEA